MAKTATAPRARSNARETTSRTVRKTETAPTANDALALLEFDHLTVEKLFQELERPAGTAARSRDQLARRVIRELSVHAAVEEQILYPVLSEIGAEGKTAHSLQEHMEVKEALSRLGHLSSEDEEFDEVLEAVMQDVREHVDEEENELFPLLRASIPADRLEAMGRAIQAAKSVAPTRPHPEAPDLPPGNIVVGLVFGVVDRALDIAGAVTSRFFGMARAMVEGVARRATRS